MRIISGEFRGRRLKAPAGLGTRPTSDRLREALFNILGAEVAGSRFLDLFAGSGAVGLEAASRGAESVVFVEHSRRALALLEENIESCGAGETSRIVPKDVVGALRSFAAQGLEFDIAYVDPPYDAGLYGTVLGMLGRGELVAPDGVVVVERRARGELADEYGALRHYRDVTHGDSTLAFYHRG
jgi:16S rRNA (guanine(966)-N(2))-methyltransferase RsmD